MANPIRVDFQVGGIKEVTEAFRSVTDAARAMQAQVRRTTREGVKLAQEQARASVTAEGQKTRAAQDADAYLRRIARNTKRMLGELDQKALRDFISAQREQTEAFRRAEDERTAALLKAIKKRNAAAKTMPQSPPSPRTNNPAAGLAGAIVGSARGAIGTVGRAAGAITGIMGGFSVADAAQRGLTARGAAADLANQAGLKVSARDIRERATTVGTQFGMETGDVIAGLDAFVAKSGDVVSGMKAIGQLVELATATGADLRELSQTAGIVQMGTGDIGKTLAQMRVLAGAGREGSVDMRELATYAGRISAGSSQYVDKGAAFSQLTAIVQQAAATGGATAAPEATEAIVRLSTDVLENADKFQALGIKTRDPSGNYLRDPKQLIQEAIVKTKGDPAKLLELFGKMSYRAVAGFQDIYNRAGKGKEGEKAMAEAFDRFEKAALAESQVKEDAARRLQEADKKFASAMNAFREQVSDKVIPALVELLPRVQALVPAFIRMLEKMVTFVEWFADNPIKGLGAIVAGKVVADLAAAKIGEAVSAILARALGVLFTGQTVAGAAAGAAAGAGAGGVGAGAGAAAGGLIPRLVTAGRGALNAGASAVLPELGAGVGAASAGGIALASGAALSAGAVAGAVISEAIINEQKKDLRGATSSVADLRAQMADVGDLNRNPKWRQRKARELRAKVKQLLAQNEDNRDNAGSYVMGTVATITGQGDSYSDARAAEERVYTEAIKDLSGMLERLETTIRETTYNNRPLVGGESNRLASMPPVNASVPMSSPLRSHP